MPELPDVEGFREVLNGCGGGRRVQRVEVRDTGVLRGVSAQRLRREVEGQRLGRPWRHGKLLIVPVSDGPALIWHFGMTGGMHRPGGWRGWEEGLPMGSFAEGPEQQCSVADRGRRIADEEPDAAAGPRDQSIEAGPSTASRPPFSGTAAHRTTRINESRHKPVLAPSLSPRVRPGRSGTRSHRPPRTFAASGAVARRLGHSSSDVVGRVRPGSGGAPCWARMCRMSPMNRSYTSTPITPPTKGPTIGIHQ